MSKEILIKIPAVRDWSITELKKCCRKHKIKGFANMDRDTLIDIVEDIIIKVKTKAI